jgi:hypothetical protein
VFREIKDVEPPKANLIVLQPLGFDRWISTMPSVKNPILIAVGRHLVIAGCALESEAQGDHERRLGTLSACLKRDFISRFSVKAESLACAVAVISDEH